MNTSNKHQGANEAKLFAAGLLFSILWPSAAAATKIGLKTAQPFVICIARFFTAGILMLLITHGILRNRLPQKQEWKQIAIYGLLNISLYLGLYVLAMQQISPGLGSLAIATNPVFISLISALIFKQRIGPNIFISLILCVAGVILAAVPLLQNSFATPTGLLILLLSMLIYSAGTIYFSRQSWHHLHMLTINGWQTLLGGVFLLPLAIFTFNPQQNHWNMEFIGSVLWLAIPVSVVAVQLWLYLLRDSAVRASFWLFLCPLAGFIIAHFTTHEPIGVYTVAGMLMVIAGLYLAQKRKKD
ncbi:MAG: EamA family transporter [Chitinophagaceae bacterium]